MRLGWCLWTSSAWPCLSQAVQLRSFWTALLAVDNTVARAFFICSLDAPSVCIGRVKHWHFCTAALWPLDLENTCSVCRGAHWVFTDKKRRMKIWLRKSVTGRFTGADKSLPGQGSLYCWKVSYIFRCCGSSPGAPAVLRLEKPQEQCLSWDLKGS